MLPAAKRGAGCRAVAVCGPSARVCSTLLLSPAARRTAVVVSAKSERRGSSGGWYDAPPASSRGGRPQRHRDDQQQQQQQQQQEQQRRKHYYESQPRRGSRPQQQQEDVQQQQQQQQQQLWGPSRGGGADRGSSGDRRAWQDDDDINDNDDGPGWWEVPREARAAQQAAAALDLELQPWQEEQLLLAAGGSKKKMQVQTLAANLGLDRTEVLSWVAAFRAKPKHEQQKLLAPHAHKLQQQQAQWAAEAAVKQEANQQQLQQHQRKKQQQVYDPWGDLEEASSSSSSSSRAPLPFSEPNRDTGFVPFAERRAAAGPQQQLPGRQQQPGPAAGAAATKRLPAEVLRTLEGVYSRSPWPSRDVVAGLYDLHRLPRDVALQWFEVRRVMDGLPSNPRDAKRAGLRASPLLTAATADGSSDGSAAEQPLLPPSLRGPQGPRQQQQGQQQQGQQQQAAPVARLTARELIALRSSLPSPKKHKGARLAAELGIKMGAEPDKQVEIGGLLLVARDGAAAWRGAWRRRRAAVGLPAQRLDFQPWFTS